jgi:hypothetical protein
MNMGDMGNMGNMNGMATHSLSTFTTSMHMGNHTMSDNEVMTGTSIADMIIGSTPATSSAAAQSWCRSISTICCGYFLHYYQSLYYEFFRHF